MKADFMLIFGSTEDTFLVFVNSQLLRCKSHLLFVADKLSGFLWL